MESGCINHATLAIIAVCTAMICFSSCQRNQTIVVGSKNFTEQIVLGEMAAQQIETELKITVDRRLDLGGTLLAHLALSKGDIDLYPEYTGTALATVLKQPLSTDPKQVFETVSRLYRQRFHLRWLPPLGFNDTFAMAVRREDADRLTAKTLSAAQARRWRLGVGYEFLTRADGLTRLDSIYKFRWGGLPRTMDLGLLYRALSDGQIDMAAANSTDGLLTSGRYVVLDDDRRAFPSYEACFVVREDVLAKFQGLQTCLDRLSNSLNEQTMRQLNRQVDIDHVPVVRVVANFLARLNQKKMQANLLR
jgi:osmoprotectant transport system substrate-binding protein